MAANYFHGLSDLRPGSYNWNVKVRIIRSWRGQGKSGEGFKGLNIMLLDDKNDRMHAFVPGNIIEKHENNLQHGNICQVSNFTVKDYRSDEKFRCVKRDRQIIFTSYTQCVPQTEEDSLIAQNFFDFYDLSDLEAIANQNVYLTDVIGVIERDLPLADLTNKYGKPQKLIKFTIVDGRCSVNVSFWDSLAEEFETTISQVEDYPPIIIIASAKITSWQAPNQTTPQLEISNVTATKFYMNYDHPNVKHLRRMLGKPLFAKYNFATHRRNKIENLSVAEIKNLTMDFIQKEVICNIKVTHVFKEQTWFFFECTSCYQQIEPREGSTKCYRCADRNVPHPYKKWRFHMQAEDDSGIIFIEIKDREARSILGMHVEDLQIEEKDFNVIPPLLKSLEKKLFCVKLEIEKKNIGKEDSTYLASGIYEVFSNEDVSNMQPTEMSISKQDSVSQASGSTFHLDDFSQLTFASPEVKKKSKRIITKKRY